MFKLEKALILARLETLLTAIKAYVDTKLSALATTVSEILRDVNTSLISLEAEVETKGNCEILIFESKSVDVTDWTEDSSYGGCSYSADIICEGVTEEYIPDVIFDLPEAASGIFAPISKTKTNHVTIYATSIPDGSITIPTIKCIIEAKNITGEVA